MKILFFVAVAVYAGLMLLGLQGTNYRDTETSDIVFQKALIYLIILSILIGGGFVFWVKSVFPRWYQKQNTMGRIMLPLMFVIFSFAFNRSIMMLYNNYGGGQTVLHLSGPVIEKYVIKEKYVIQERGSRSHYLVIINNRDKKQYRLRLTEKAYRSFGTLTEYFDKEFKVGALGIIYRRDL